jgi:hypothetical protein
MQQYIFNLSNGKTVERKIEAETRDEALGIALTALSHFASSNLPPPDKIEIIIMTERRERLATLRFRYELEVADEALWAMLQ